jgi:YidC/Oxa1 family membrane protein insertase
MQQDKESQKNLVLAIVLSVLVLFGWQYFYAGPKLKEEQERRQRAAQQQQQGAPTTQPGTAPVPGASSTPQPTPNVTTPGTAAAPQYPGREAALAQSPRVGIETPSLRGSIALKGGRIDDIVLQKYREKVDPTSPNVVLFSPAGTKDAYFAEYGWTTAAGAAVKVPTNDTVWTQRGGGKLTPETPVTLTWNNGDGLTFERTVSVDADYLFKVVDSVRNASTQPVTLYPYARVFRYGTPPTQGFFILHEGPLGVFGEQGLKEPTYADVQKDGGSLKFEKVTNGWVGITDKYWASALIPPTTQPFTGQLTGIKKTPTQSESYQTDYLLDGVTIAAGASGETSGHLFAGAKQVHVIDGYREKLGVKQFDLMVDWGWFYFITKPLFKLMSWLTQLLGNYGLAILATTVLVKLAFFPLANKSYASMAKMKKLQPEMERIRETWKDDRVRQQQEMMELYKKEQINPAAGCLPILLQIPVFFALYKVLFVTIDMRHAPFYGWIKDLSAPDPTSIFNLFGLLPFVTPEFLTVGAWPIIMGITMFFQMQLNPQQPDPIQQQIFNWMPVIFTFLLASFPAGLVIYWAWNNVLSLAQQYWIMRKNGTEVHLWKNLGLERLFGEKKSAKT